MYRAGLWGPVVLAIALGMFISPSFYKKIYRDLEKDALAVLLFGMAAMTLGIAQTGVHNVWETVPEILVSILGWGALVKGAVFVIAPRLADQAGDNWLKLKLMPVSGIVMFLIGGYLTWFAYFA